MSPVLARDPGQAQKNTTPPSVFFRFIVHLPVLADRFFLFFLSLSLVVYASLCFDVDCFLFYLFVVGRNGRNGVWSD